MTDTDTTPDLSSQQTDSNPNISLSDFTEETTSYSHTKDEPTIPIDFDLVADEHVCALAQELSYEEIEQMIASMVEEPDIVAAIEPATTDEALASNIDIVTGFYAEQPSLVEAAGDAIAETFGMRPFELQITDPENDYQKAMVSLTVDENVWLTANSELNAELLCYATSIEGETQTEQRKVFELWRDAIGGEHVAEFKQDRDPDALGFTIPGQIPATGDNTSRTPITEFPYIGDATAREIHPANKIMSVTDYVELTQKQRVWISFPIDNRDYDNVKARGIANGFAEHIPSHDNLGNILGEALEMKDQRGSDGDYSWVDPAMGIGITQKSNIHEQANTADVVEVTEESNTVAVEASTGHVTKYKTAYWKLLEVVSDGLDCSIAVGVDDPTFVALNKEEHLVAAPKQ